MATRYSPERRIVLWRRALFQFRKFKDREGAFNKAGYRYFRVEQALVGPEETRPDIIGWKEIKEGENRAVVVELTLNNSKSKAEQLERYARLRPSQLLPVGISTTHPPIVVIGSLMPFEHDPEYCRITLGNELSCEGVEHLDDPDLRAALNSSIGDDLVRIPSLPFTIVPESKYMEVRRGIAPDIMQRFTSGSEGFSAEEITMGALDFLAEHIDRDVLDKVVSEVNIQITRLVSKYLSEYIEIAEDGVFILTDKGKTVHRNPRSMEKVNRQISAWMWEKTIETYLSQFDSQTDSS